MDSHIASATEARMAVTPSYPGATLVVFSATIFLSALLLFSVQPMFAKMVLPILGGSPSVWAVSMCFFQAALLAGYCWAHVLDRHLPGRAGPLVHMALLTLAVFTLPIALPATASEPPAGNAYLWLVGTLALGVGLPFFCVSASAPLLQTWFARSGHPQAHDPYFLYAASNLGSLLALLSYPFVVEPWSGVAMQSVVWMWAFVVLLGGMALCATSARASNADARGAERGLVPAEVPGRWVERLHWTALAFVPSGLLVAFSTHITTDVASAPLLWVLPLAAFLLTFVLVFRERPVLPHGIVLAVQPVLVILALGGMAVPGHLTHVIGTFAGAVCFFVTMLVAHRELYLKRPEPGRLTEFYLWMSFGGVLGGMFAALLAPQIFSRNWEYVLLLTLGMACRPWDVARCRAERDLRETVIAFIVVAGSIAVAAFAFGAKWLPASHGASVMVGSLVVLGALAVAAWKQPVRQLACIVAILATVVLLPSRLSSGHSERSFFGVHRVYESADGTYRLLSHGTTVHGAQRIAETGGRPTPLTYYHPHGPIAFGIEAARSATVGRSREFSVGVVGLGAGSVACYHRAGEKWSFYEIDPVVVRMARDPHLFTFLSKCQPNARIVLGDARLTLAHVPAGGFDHLLIDAFSSDAIPVHLLTVEALRLYLSKLSPRGLLTLHVSNRYLDLGSVLAATTAAIPGAHALLAKDDTTSNLDAVPSHVVYVSLSTETLAEVAKGSFVGPLPKTDIAPWTDDWSDIITAMWRKRR